MCGLVPLLIPSAACGYQENLSAALIGMMDVPIVATSRLKGDISDGHLLGAKHREITLPSEVLCIGIDRKQAEVLWHHVLSVLSF